MSNAQEKATAFGIKIPLGVPEYASVMPPQAQSPTSQNIQFESLKALAQQVALENRRRLNGYKIRIAAYKELRIDPPYLDPPPVRIQHYLAADKAGKVSDSNSWALGIPPDYEFLVDLYFWIWDN